MYIWLFLPLVFLYPEVRLESAPPKLHTVEIRGMKFVPAEIQVNKGDTIIWINQDVVIHNVTEEKRKAWASPSLSTGKSWKMVIKENGNYFCSLHPVMKGKIIVK